MILEAILSYLHISAILAMVVFITSEGSICRPEWFNEAVLKRMLRVDLIYMICGAAVGVTGLMRVVLGAKGSDWYMIQPMLHVKVLLYLIVGIIAIKVSVALQKWLGAFEKDGSLPAEAEIRRVRRLIMIEAHIIMVIPLFAVLFARGIFGAAT